MRATIMLFHTADGKDLRCIESIEGDARTVADTAVATMRTYTIDDNIRSGRTDAIASTGWLSVGKYVCCQLGDYFALGLPIILSGGRVLAGTDTFSCSGEIHSG